MRQASCWASSFSLMGAVLVMEMYGASWRQPGQCYPILLDLRPQEVTSISAPPNPADGLRSIFLTTHFLASGGPDPLLLPPALPVSAATESLRNRASEPDSTVGLGAEAGPPAAVAAAAGLTVCARYTVA